MKAYALLIFTCLALVGCRNQAPGIHGGLTTPAGRIFHLWTIPDEENISIMIDWPDDWFQDPANNGAVREVGTELLMAGGAEGLPPADLQEQFKALQANGHLWVSGSVAVQGQLYFPKKNAEKAIALANTVITRPSLDQGWLERIKEDKATSAEQAALQIGGKLRTAVWHVLYKAEGPAYLASNEPENLRQVSRDEVDRWRRRLLTSRGLDIAIAGNLDGEEAGRMIDALLAGLPETEVPRRAPMVTEIKSQSILVHDSSLENAALSIISSPGPATMTDEIVLQVGVLLLSGDTDGLLFKNLRERLKATYGFSTSTWRVDKTTLLEMAGELDPAKVEPVANDSKKTLLSLRTDLQPDANIDLLKTRIQEGVSKMVKDAGSASGLLLGAVLEGKEPGQADDIADITKTVTRDLLKKTFARIYPENPDMLTVAVSPDATVLPGACTIKDPHESGECP